MSRLEEKRNLTAVEMLLLAVFMAEVLYYVYCNFAHMQHSIESDLAKMMVHTIEMARNKTFLIPNWNYTTTAEWDTAALPAIVFFLLTGNIYLSYALVNTLTILFWIFIINRLMTQAGLERVWRLLTLAVVFGHFDMDDTWYTADMLFTAGAQYTYKVLLPLLFLTLLYAEPAKRRDKKQVALTVLFGIMMVVTGASSGIYTLLCGILPILLCLCIFYLTDRKQGDRHDLWFSLIAVGCLLFGMGLCRLWHVTPGSSAPMDLRTMAELKEAPLKTLISLFEVWYLFPARNVMAMSVDGIAMIVKFVFVCGLLGFGLSRLPDVFGVRRLIRGQQVIDTAERIRICLISVFAWNFLILMLTNTAARYQLIGTVPLTLCAVCALRDLSAKYMETPERNRLRDGLIVLVAASLALILAVAVRYTERTHYHGTEGTIAFCNELIPYLEKEGMEKVLLLNERELSELLRFYDDSDRLYSHVIVTEDEVRFFNWDYYKTTDDMGLFETAAIIGTQEAIAKLPEELLGERVLQEEFQLDTHFKKTELQVWLAD